MNIRAKVIGFSAAYFVGACLTYGWALETGHESLKASFPYTAEHYPEKVRSRAETEAVAGALAWPVAVGFHLGRVAYVKFSKEEVS